jgi:3-deoxy-D-manno-octulosonic-acid transferase
MYAIKLMQIYKAAIFCLDGDGYCIKFCYNTAMLRYLYSCLFYLAVPFILSRLLWRSRTIPQYRQRWLERFAYFKVHKQQQHGIWLHAVSLGEFVAAIPMVRALLQQYPDLPLTITSMTITGSNRIYQEFGNQVYHYYVPYDLPSVVKRFLKKVQPKLIIILETELWPNILHYCGKQHIPVLLSNARLSQRSMQGYQRIAKSTRAMLQNITLLAAHAQTDAERFVELGLPASRVVITGSIKFEIVNSPSIFEQAAVLRHQFAQRLVWIAASTHEGEEKQVLNAFQTILKTVPEALLILVPRHPERFTQVKELCSKQGFHVITRSSGEPCSMITQIFLGDTMGELKLFYAASDVAFVGGSLVAIGGHNVLESIGLNIPTITGPNMFNFSEINTLLLQAKAIKQINNQAELAQAVISLLQEPTARAEMQRNGEKVLSQNRGALQKNLDLVQQILSTEVAK